MRDFDYVAPTNLREAVVLLAKARGKARPFAGGSDLIDQMRVGHRNPSLVVDVKRIPELNRLEYESGKGLHIGAAVPCARIYSQPLIRKRYPVITSSCGLIGDVKIQNRAGIGGNFCNAAPSADTAPPVIVCGGICIIVGQAKGRLRRRRVLAEDFFVAPGKSVLRPGELLVEILLPPPLRRSAAAYQRFIPRNEMDIAIAGAASWIQVGRGRIIDARISLAAVAPVPMRARRTERALIGNTLTADLVRQAGQSAARECRPIDDVRGSAWYRRDLVHVLTVRTLERCARSLGVKL